MALCTDTKTAIIESIDESICEVFEMMAGSTLTRLSTECPTGIAEDDAETQPDLSVVMGLTGELQGSLSLSMTSEAARRWTQSLIDHQATEIDQTVIDAVGELGNMVVGGAKRRLCGYVLKMALPSVIRVGTDDIVFPSSTTPLEVRYGYEGSVLTILIALQKQPKSPA